MGKRSREKRERRKKGEIRLKTERGEKSLPFICLNTIRLGTYLLLFAPLIISAKFFFPFVGPKSLYFMGLVEIIFAAYLFLILIRPEYRPRFNILLIALILFVAVLILATVFGADISRSFWSKYERMTGLLMWFHLLGFFVVISSVFKREEDWFKIFALTIFVAVLISLISLGPKIGLEISPSTRGGATIGNSSFMGTYLLFNIFLALYLFLQSRGGLRIYSGIGLALISLGLFLSEARATILSVLGGLILLFFLYLIFLSQKPYLRLLGKVLLVESFLILLISTFLVFQPDNIIHQKFIEKASQARLVVWEKAWKGFLERPYLGWGPENFDFVFTKFYNPCMFLPECGGEIWFDRAHNIIFDTLINSGIIGFLSYLGIFFAAFYILWQKFFRKELNFWIPSIFSVVLISYLVQNLTVFDMVNSYLMFLLILGFVGGISYPPRPPLAEPRRLKFLWPLILIILIFFSVSFSKLIIQPLQTDAYVIQALRAQTFPERLSLYKKTLNTSPLGKYQIRNFFSEQFQSLFQTEKRKEIPKKDLEAEFDFLSGELEKSIKESPLDYRSHLRLGQLYNLWVQLDPGKISLAEKVLKKAIELSPTNQQGYWSLIQTKLYQNRGQEALALAEKAVELEPKLGQSHLILVQIAKFIGDYDLAQKKIEEAIKINPAWESQLKKILTEGS
ncbi:MAG: O-antigen ligase family protein [Patescibacteria group bacterium]|nr:O-antigen ligase family protein [Patescibacteria group bacterium]